MSAHYPTAGEGKETATAGALWVSSRLLASPDSCRTAKPHCVARRVSLSRAESSTRCRGHAWSAGCLLPGPPLPVHVEAAWRAVAVGQTGPAESSPPDQLLLGVSKHTACRPWDARGGRVSLSCSGLSEGSVQSWPLPGETPGWGCEAEPFFFCRAGLAGSVPQPL